MTDAPHAQLDWDETGQPRSRQFGDVYFSQASGLDETRHVFLANNDLAARFAALPAGGGLTIGETGFGTGLNFLAAWACFEEHGPADARLRFVSVEKYPLRRDDLARALSLWPQLAHQAEALLGQYVAVHPGFQRLCFANGRVTLTLLVGDVLEMLPQLDARIDAWFLDGFSPAKNPQMWTPALFAELARLSAPGATLGTFTSAGFVRRGLIEAGFAMQRTPGQGRKREVLKGVFVGPAEAQPRAGGATSASVKAWYARPPAWRGTREALVVGAGLAGCATAASLAARGWRVTVLERREAAAREGSGNPQGILYLKLSAHGTALSRLVVAGFGHTRRLLERLVPGEDWSPCGVLQLAYDEAEAARQAQLAGHYVDGLLQPLDREGASARAGVALEQGGLFFPEAGWAHPPALCRHLLDHPAIRLVTHREAVRLERRDGLWRAWAEDGEVARAPLAVLACAADAARFEPAASLPLKRIRGQISRLPATPDSRALRTVLCAEGYVAPTRHDEHTLGASFDFHRQDDIPSATEHASNLALLEQLSPDLARRLEAGVLDAHTLEGRVGFRCTTPDYLPVVGPLAEAGAFAEAYGVLARDARQAPATPCPWLEGLYVNTGHGSRGLVSAPLSGELLAAWLEDEPLPLPRAVAEACHPNRFPLRRLIRGH